MNITLKPTFGDLKMPTKENTGYLLPFSRQCKICTVKNKTEKEDNNNNHQGKFSTYRCEAPEIFFLAWTEPVIAEKIQVNVLCFVFPVHNFPIINFSTDLKFASDVINLLKEINILFNINQFIYFLPIIIYTWCNINKKI